jgi:hypothetical protein
LVEDGADGVSISLGDEKHAINMVIRRTAGKRSPKMLSPKMHGDILRRLEFPSIVTKI